MNAFDYILDSGLVLLVLIQIKERRLATKDLLRPVVLVGLAVLHYMHGIPTAGNDLVLIAAFGLLGGLIGTASGQAVIMQVKDGAVTARAGWASAVLWVAGMGSRFAFILWINHGGQGSLAHFSAQHSITSGEAWTVALLAMAVAEVLGRTAVMAIRRNRMQRAEQPAGRLQPAA